MTVGLRSEAGVAGVAVPGPVLFARYAFPPNALGYCGPGDSHALLEYAAATTVDRGLVELAKAFEGAWPYLELIAAANGIRDPLDRAVVEAYWVGNALLDHVPTRLLAASLDDRFRRRAGRRWEKVLAPVGAGAVAHHNLHVLGVSPWIGLLRGGDVEPALTVLDQCRIREGRIESIDGDRALVRTRPLVWEDEVLRLGPAAVEPAVVAVDGLTLVDVAVGDWVALHWDWVCDRLDDRQRLALRRATAQILACCAPAGSTAANHP